jgi:hypothetical protein
MDQIVVITPLMAVQWLQHDGQPPQDEIRVASYVRSLFMGIPLRKRVVLRGNIIVLGVDVVAAIMIANKPTSVQFTRLPVAQDTEQVD